jgi:hypothetical protein
MTLLYALGSLTALSAVGAVMVASYAATVARETSDTLAEFISDYVNESADWRCSVSESLAAHERVVNHRLSVMAQQVCVLQSRQNSASRYTEGLDEYRCN